MGRRRQARWAGLVLLPALLLAGCSGSPGRGAGADDLRLTTPVVVVGVGGLTWADITPAATPRLWELLASGAGAAAVTVRQDGPTCPVDGWLALSAGRLVAGRGPTTEPGGRPDPADPLATLHDVACGPLPAVRPAPGGRAVVPAWDQLEERQEATEFEPRLGLLANALAAVDVCATAVGPGAALALAGADGTVRRYHEASGPGAFACPLTLVDGGMVVDPARDLAAVDRSVAAVLDAAPDAATVLVTGVSEQPGGPPELGAALLTRTGDGGTAATGSPRWLVTSSTRWDGVVRLLDLPTSLLAAVGVDEPGDLSGAPLRGGGQRPADPAATAEALDDITRADQVRGTWADDLRTWSGGLQLVLYAAALALARWGRAPRGSGRLLVAPALGFATLPLAAYLVTLTSWWRAAEPDRALGVGLAAITAGLALVAGLVPGRPPWRAVGGLSLVTFAVLVVDGVAGTPLHRISLLGSSPARGGRYFGFGNDTFCVLVVAALLLAGALAAELAARGRRRAAVGAVVGVGALTVLVDVWPTWGADVGGGLALPPGVALLALVVAGVRVTPLRLSGATLAGVGLVAAVALADWLRAAEDRSHLGRFVQDLVDGDAWETIGRKAGYARGSLDGNAAAWVTLALLVASAAALLRPERCAPAPLRAAFAAWPTLRATLGAILLTVVVGSVVNDYGLRIGTISLVVGLPFVALACVRAGATTEGPGSGSGEGGAGVSQSSGQGAGPPVPVGASSTGGPLASSSASRVR